MHWCSIIESQHPVKVETLNLDLAAAPTSVMLHSLS
jgi:hypothetical protein